MIAVRFGELGVRSLVGGTAGSGTGDRYAGVVGD
jgi:hypothetical protein